ncbi:MAG: tetratricopeptide repeat protein [Anaerolineales bacterium]|nr:tetratricopeptide repeat protein [Anaerolineales bacterium]
MTDLSGRKFGKYELIEQLGRGGMAEVYKAYQPGMNRFVAVKVLHGHLAGSEDFVERFKREAQSVGQLRHPNILQVFDFDVEQNVYYMVMEYIEGDTLKSYIRQRGAIPIAEALRLAELLADALDYAHKKHMVHRDIKPANVMFTDKEHKNPVLTDFGIARLLGDAGLTMSGAFVGTPAYMSPEAGRGEKVDERADIYSLGIMLFEMLTGRVPFDADTPFAVVMKHVNEPLPSMREVIRDLPPEVELVLLKSLSKDPQDRFQTASDFRVALQRVRENLGSYTDADSTTAGVVAGMGEQRTLTDEKWSSTASQSARGTTPIDPTKQKSIPYTLIAGGVGAAVVLLVLVALILGGNGDENDNEATSDGSPSAAEVQATGTAIVLQATEDATTENATPETLSPNGPNGPPTVVADRLNDDLLDEGRRYLEDAAFNDAIQVLQRVIERDPDNAMAYALLGRAFLGADDLAAALTNLDTALSMDNSISQAYFDRGKARTQIEDWEGATRDLTTLLDSRPPESVQVEALALRGIAYNKSGNHEAALADFNAALAIDPNNNMALLNRAWLSLTDGEIEAAINDLNRSIDNGNASAETYLARGQALVEMGDSEAAIDDFSDAIELDAALAQAYFERGILYSDRGDQDEALNDFNVVVSLDPENRAVYPLRADIYMQDEDWPEAIDDYSVALQYEPDNLDYRNQRGWARLQVGNHEQALRDFNRVLEIDPDNVIGLTYRGFAYMVTNDLESALVDVNHAIELAPDSAWAYQIRANVALLQTDYANAEADAQQALALDANAVDSLSILGQVARANGNYEEALSYFNRYLQEKPLDGVVLAERGAVYIELERYEEAVADLDQAIRIDSDNFYFFADRGVAYAGLHQWDAAIADLTIALNNDPNAAYWLDRRSQAYIAVERYEEALIDLGAWLEIEPDNAQALTHRAIVQFSLGNFDEALADADRATSFDDGLAWPYVVRGWLAFANQDNDGALTALNEAIDRNSTIPEAFKTRGQIYQLQGNTEQAITDFREAITQGDESPKIYVLLAETYQDSGDFEAAEGVLQEAIAAGHTDANVYLALGNVYDSLGQTEDALAAFGEYVRLAGDDALTEIVERVGPQVPQVPETVNINTRFMPYLTSDDPAVLEAANEVDQVAINEGGEPALRLINQYFTDFPNDPILLSLRSDIYRDMGRTEDSLQDAQTALDMHPEHPASYLAMSRYYFFVEYDGEQAFEYVQQAYDLAHNQPEVLLHYATALEWHGDFDGAVEYYDRAEAAGAPLATLLWERGDALMNASQYDRAAADYVRYIDEISDYYEARIYAAGAFMLAGDNKSALELMRVGVVNYDTPEFYARASYVPYRAGDYELATEWANTALAFDGNQVIANYVLALIAAAQGNYDTALNTLMALEEVEEWQYDWPYLNSRYGHSLYVDMAHIYIAQGDDEKALEMLNQAIANDNYGFFAYVERAHWYWQQGDQDRALSDYLTAIYNHFYDAPSDSAVLMQEVINLDYNVMLEGADYYVWDQEPDMLFRYVELALEAYPDDPWLLLYRVRGYLIQGDGEAAFREIRQIQQQFPEHPAGYVGLSEYYYFLDQPENMMTAAEEANKREAEHPQVRLNYVRALWVNDRDDEAIPLYKTMTGDGFFLFGFMEERADYMTGAREYEQAIQDWTVVMSLYPNTEALWELTSSYIVMEQPEAALEVAEAHTNLEPNNPRFWVALGYVAYAAGDNDRANEWLEEARAIDPESAAATYLQALLATQAGDYETALTLLQGLVEVDTWQYEYPFLNQRFGHTVNLDIARTYRQMGNTEQALAFYADLPYSAEVYLERGDYFVELGRTEDARADYMRAEDMTDDSDLRREIRSRIVELGPAPSATPSQ